MQKTELHYVTSFGIHSYSTCKGLMWKCVCVCVHARACMHIEIL